MYRAHDDYQSISAPVALGLLAFMTHALFGGMESSFAFPFENILLFMAPLAFGFRGAVMAIGAGVIPIALISLQPHSGIRISALLMALGVCQRVIPWLPGYCVTFLLWLGVIFPLRMYFTPRDFVEAGWSEELSMFCWLSDMFATLVAGCLLLNATIWCFVTRSPRQPRITTLVTHVLSITVLISVLGVFATLNRLRLFTGGNLDENNELAAFALMCSFISIPTVIGFRLALTLLRDGPKYIEMAPMHLGSSMLSTDAKQEWFDDLESEGEFKAVGDSTESNDEFQSQDMTGVCAIDSDGSILFMNDRFRALADIALPGTAGRTLITLTQESSIVHQIAALVSATDPARELVTELRIPRTDGHARYLEVGLRPHLEEDGVAVTEPASSPRVIAIRDITNRRTIEGHLLESQRLASLSAFVLGTAASFADTFTVIAGRASQARISAQPQLQAAFDAIVEEALNAGRLATQLLGLVTPKKKGASAATDVRQALRDRVPVLQSVVGDRYQINLSVPAEELPIDVDGALFSQALTHLLTNARDAYKDTSGPIEISVATEEIDQAAAYLHPGIHPGRFARVRISDRGRGMSAEDLRHAGTPLFSTKQTSGHAGLGLPTVLAIMRDHNGFMTLESKVEKGTSVSLYFPLIERSPSTALSVETPQLETQENSPPVTIEATDRTVLILETKKDLRSVLADMLTSLGYKTSSCESGEEALSFLRSNQVDIILLDEALGALGTAELMKEIQNSHKGVRSVLMSATGDRSETSTDAVVVKPFDLRQLGKTLQSITATASSTTPAE